MTEPQLIEAMRLASRLATARVRRYAFDRGLAPMETEAGIRKRLKRSTEELRKYLETWPQHAQT